MKDNYQKCLKRRELATRSGAEAKRLPTCKELAFLNDVVQGRETHSNITSASNKQERHSEELKKHTESSPAEQISFGSTKSSTEVPDATNENIGRKRKKSKEPCGSGENKNLDALLQTALVKNLISDNSSEHGEGKDSTQLFCESLAQPLRMLTHKKNKLATIKIMEVIYQLEEDI